MTFKSKVQLLNFIERIENMILTDREKFHAMINDAWIKIHESENSKEANEIFSKCLEEKGA